MKFKTKRGIYKIWQVDTVNCYAYDVETKAELIVDVMDFSRWVSNGSITMLTSDESYIDEKIFKLPK